ncbi:AMP-binding protein [Curvibacter sp. APW13]|uniref:AMP-binding protein n=1 Tax=Curvibacter sp. APW13 TaxID=3077236 RepID=UPI0028E0265B|nr:AMP-binding protein [Curvibacter sp. APW13]MDT8989514.1 AMP-binding protein [Curvibacter sp. APW13]
MQSTVTVKPSDLPLQCLYRWESQRRDAVYLTQPTGGGAVDNITWGQAAEQVRRMATWLQSHGWEAGSRVAVLGKNSAHWILADLAIQMAGYVSVPIYPTFNAEALAYILEHSEAKACFIGKLDDTANVHSGIPQGFPVVVLPLAPADVKGLAWNELLTGNAPLQGQPVMDGNQVSTIIYTSGTTGKPKGVVHTFNTMAWGVSSATKRIPMDANDRYISYLPLAHVAERMLVEQASLRYGGQIFFAESLDTFLQDLQRARPTIFFSVPRLWVKFQHGIHSKMPAKKLNFLLSLPLIGGLVRKKILTGLGLDQCRIAAGGAAPMPAEVLRWYRRLGLDLIEVYGMTENCGVSHCTLPGSDKSGNVGFPYEGVDQRIDPETGEIQMRCPALMLGYYKEPVLTREAIGADGWLHTGDKGQINAEGAMVITGRVKDIFKTSKGKYVAPAHVEDLLVRHTAVEACLVTGANLPQPIALLLLSPDASASAQNAEGKAALTAELAQHLKDVNAQLEPHEKLDMLVTMTTPWTPENGFVTPTLKVKRPVMEAAFSAQFEAWLAQKQPVVWSGQ